MPGEGLLHSLYLRLCRCLLTTETTAETCGSLLLLEHGLYLLTVLRDDGLLSLEVLSIKMFAQIRVCEHGITAIGLGDRLQKQPTVDEAFCIRLCRRGGDCIEILRTVLEADIVHAQGTFAFVGDHKVGHTLRNVVERSGLGEPLVALVTTEATHHRISLGTTCGLLGLHGQLDAGQNLTCSTLFADSKLGVVSGLDTHDEVAVGNHAEIHIIIFKPAALRWQGSHIAAERVDGINQFAGHTIASATVAVDLDLLSSLVDTHTTHGLLHLLDGSVGIEVEFLDTS